MSLNRAILAFTPAKNVTPANNWEVVASNIGVSASRRMRADSLGRAAAGFTVGPNGFAYMADAVNTIYRSADGVSWSDTAGAYPGNSGDFSILQDLGDEITAMNDLYSTDDSGNSYYTPDYDTTWDDAATNWDVSTSDIVSSPLIKDGANIVQNEFGFRVNIRLTHGTSFGVNPIDSRVVDAGADGVSPLLWTGTKGFRVQSRSFSFPTQEAEGVHEVDNLTSDDSFALVSSEVTIGGSNDDAANNFRGVVFPYAAPTLGGGAVFLSTDFRFMWRSEDGLSWTRSALTDLQADWNINQNLQLSANLPEVRSCTSWNGNGGIVCNAFVQASGGGPTYWAQIVSSDDGKTWEVIPKANGLTTQTEANRFTRTVFYDGWFYQIVDNTLYRSR